jgi:hypothetical protein
MDPIFLVLGDFVFQDMEIPESIPFGGSQQLAVKKLIGGGRVIDAMGTDPKPIEWSGTFFPTADGQSALDRAQQIQGMKDDGRPLQLSWDQILLYVYIKDFEPDYRFGRIPYKISFEILVDATQPFSAATGTPLDTGADDGQQDVDDLIGNDVYAASNLAAELTSGISSLMGDVVSAINAVTSFVGAVESVVAPIMQTVCGLMNAVSILSGTVDGTLNSASSPGGVASSTSPMANLAAYEAQLAANSQQTSLVQLQALLGRILKNLQQVNSSVKTVTVSGGNLFDVAAKQYGDPTAWTVIAQANGLADPQLTGIVTLIIPPYSGASAGVLGS